MNTSHHKKTLLFVGLVVISLIIFTVFSLMSSSDSHQSTEISPEKNQPIVSENRETLPENFSDIDANLFETLMKNNEYTVIDLRTPEEIQQGKIFKNALEIDFYAEDFEAKLKKLDPSKKYLIYCHSGRRSGNTLLGMKQMKFSHAYDLKGGIAEWERQGKMLNQ